MFSPLSFLPLLFSISCFSHLFPPITASFTTFTSTSSIHNSLFGSPAVTPAPSSDLTFGVHPRIVFNSHQWTALLKRYAVHHDTPNSWAQHQRHYSFSKGPTSGFVTHFANLDVSAYKGATEDLTQWSESERASLKPLAENAVWMNEFYSHQLFMCAFWASVDKHIPNDGSRLLPDGIEQKCIKATANWATVLLAHRVYTCASDCSSRDSGTRAFIWDYTKRYEVKNDWYSGGLSLAMVYDVLFHNMTQAQRRVIRSAIALLVLNKSSWGSTPTSTRDSPNAAIHPHRIFSNWAPYHSNLYLTNLAIEGDTDYDIYTAAVLKEEGSSGFNAGLDTRFAAMLKAYMDHSVYPDGGTFEDGYTFFISLREGSLALIAATRRGLNLVNSQRFRALIHNLVQMIEPWHCGQVLGGASGGGLSYPTYIALFRYVYPDGALPQMLWRNRFGDNFENNNPCRIDWHQHMIQISILAAEHDDKGTKAIAPEFLTTSQKKKLPTAFHTTRRGLIFMRDGWWQDAAIVHFDARPDAFFPGHDNADRGVFTYTAMRQTWLTDLPEWRSNIDSRKHSLLHIDGLAMDEKAPSVHILKTFTDGGDYIAAANLTYAYNVQWARSWPDASPPRRHVVTYGNDGVERHVNTLFEEKEIGDPRKFGWPIDDIGEDLGFTRPESNMWGDPDVGFMGFYTWKRDYRDMPLRNVVRSVALVKGDAERPGCALVADSVEVSYHKIPLLRVHKYEAYYVLNDGVSINEDGSVCSESTCKIELVHGSKRADLIVVASPDMALSMKVEQFETEAVHTRIIVSGVKEGSVQLWTVVCARVAEMTRIVDLEVLPGYVARLKRADTTSLFKIETKQNTMVRASSSDIIQISPAPHPPSKSDPVLFGPAAVTPAPSADLAPGVHPRIIFNRKQWQDILSSYAQKVLIPKTWAHHHKFISLHAGPGNTIINKLANLDTSAYKGDADDMKTWSSLKRSSLGPLADILGDMTEGYSHSLFLCTFWSGVNEKLESGDKFLDPNTWKKCKKAAVAWAKVLLAHRVYNCAGTCPSGAAKNKAYLWDFSRRFAVSSDWYTSGAGLALTFDLLYDRMDSIERRTIRSALAMLVLHKASWGNTISSNRISPNAAIHPHRVYSNWALYHSNLYITNLALKGEYDYDVYATSVLRTYLLTTGFNEGLNFRFTKMIEAYMTHSIYPDGGTFEDGYTYFLSFREGSLGVIAATRRGSDILDTERFRKFIINYEQMSEPWHCGQLIGHASGGGLSYPTYTGLFRYVYPKGSLPAMIWRRRFGNHFERNKPCRIDWGQHFTQITILGGEHNTAATTAISPQYMTTRQKRRLPLVWYSKRRGLIVMRDAWRENSTFVHFDARPDAFFPGHDNADRGVFTFSSLRQTWLTDLPDWRKNIDSRKHSLLHIDGLAQDEKAPSVRMRPYWEGAGVSIASADLTYAYNVQWARQWPDENPPTRHTVTYPGGVETFVNVRFTEKELGDPRDFGWPKGDDGADIGMTRNESNMWGDDHMGFMGMYTWKRAYRTLELGHVVRSLALVHGDSREGYAVLADSVDPGDRGSHVYQSYLILEDNVKVDWKNAKCAGGSVCHLILSTDDGKICEVVMGTSLGGQLRYQWEKFTTEKEHSRVVIGVRLTGPVTLWTVLYARSSDETNGLSVNFAVGESNTGLIVDFFGKTSSFEMDNVNHAIMVGGKTSPSASASPSTSSSSSPTPTTTPLPSVSDSPSSEPIPSVSPDAPDVEPMTAMRLGRKITILEESFSSDRRTFYDTLTSHTHQKVLHIKIAKEQVNEGWNSFEEFSTCNSRTLHKSITEMRVYYCGGNRVRQEKYRTRKCREVAKADDESWTCRRRGAEAGLTMMFDGDTLLPKRTYYVVVSATRAMSTKHIVVVLAHSRQWILPSKRSRAVW